MSDQFEKVCWPAVPPVVATTVRSDCAAKWEGREGGEGGVEWTVLNSQELKLQSKSVVLMNKSQCLQLFPLLKTVLGNTK